MLGSYKGHGKIKKIEKGKWFGRGKKGHGLKQGGQGLSGKRTFEQICERDEEGNQQHLEEECSRQWSTAHSKCKGPEAELCVVYEE